MIQLSDIRKARIEIGGVARRTPVMTCAAVTRRLPVYAGPDTGDQDKDPLRFKAENLQRTGSFKIRGAYYRLSQLSAGERARSVAAVSAGNHAQGVALAARLLGIEATIFMPRSGSHAKIQATEGYGAKVVLAGETFDEASQACQAYIAGSGAVYISPYDDDGIITGQGTLGLEILDDIPDLKTLVVPIGGGGLFSGLAVALKETRPSIRIIGVQAEGSDAAYQSFKAGRLLPRDKPVQTICDGIAIKSPSPRTFEYIQRYADDVVTVSDTEVVSALFVMLERAKQVVEPSGVAGVAALLAGKGAIDGRTAVVLCGGNIDMLRLADVAQREMLRTGHYLHLFTTCNDKPGGLAKVISVVAAMRGNIVEVHHNRLSARVPVGKTGVEIMIEVSDPGHADAVLAALTDAGFAWERMV